MANFDQVEVVELNMNDSMNVEGGFIPVIVFGLALSAEAVAGIGAAGFVAGFGAAANWLGN